MTPMDLHIHSTFSDGQNTPEEIVLHAIAGGMRVIMLVDHVRRSSDWVAAFSEEIHRLRVKYGNRIVIFSGLEAKFLSTNGDVDITDGQRAYVDFVLAAFHRTPLMRHGNEFNSSAWVRTILAGCQARAFDILAHPTSILHRLNLPVDKSAIIEVCAALKELNCRFELNAKHPVEPETSETVLGSEVGITVASDAHRISEIGRKLDIDQEILKRLATTWCPKFTFVIPVYNEARYISKVLESVANQFYPHDKIEVICSDGGSTDDSCVLIAKMNNGSLTVRLFNNPQQIAAAGMNLGIREAQGDRIIILGAHTLLQPDFLIQNVRASLFSGADCTGGRHANLSETRNGQTIGLAMNSAFGIGGSHYRYSIRPSFVDTVAYGAYDSKVFKMIGLFDEEMVRNQDDEFNYRLLEHGGRIYFDPRIRSQYYARSSLKKLWRQYFLYGCWKVRVMQKHPRQMRLRQFVPPTFVAALIGSSMLAVFSPLGRILLGLVAGSYVLANLIASIWTAYKGGWSHLLLLPFAFATLHLSYGLGFLVGLIKFWNRWGDTGIHKTMHKSVSEPVNIQVG
jgi:histidinol phosphatase-like PHP family hydrolase/glycosyltransferase involved in cell wall biosynthesis